MLKQGTGEGFFQKLMVLYVIVWSISPPLQIDFKYRVLALGCIGIWAIISLKKGLYVEKIHIASAFFAVLVVVIAFFEKGSLDGILQQIAIYILVLCFWINCYYRERWDELGGILLIVLVLLTFFNWKTGTALFDDPAIARTLVRADESAYIYLRQGIGGYSLIYAQVCVFPAVLMWCIKAFRKNRISFLIGLIWLISYVRCIQGAGYSIAIFTSIVGVIILFVYKRKSALFAIVISIVIFALGLGAIIYFEGFREFLLTQFDGTAVTKKINDLLLTAEEGAAEGSIYVRIEAYKDSFRTWFTYPIIGGLWRQSGGGHSAVLDMFAKYGIFGGYVFIKLFFWVPEYYKNKIKHRTIFAVSNATIVAMLFVSILDSCPHSFMCMIMLVLPLLFEDIIKWEKLQ